MQYKYNFMLKPLMSLTKQLLLHWKQAVNGKQVKYSTSMYISSISKIGSAVAIIKDALNVFTNKNK